jgi:DNA repair protein RecN (Recombination protein N)
VDKLLIFCVVRLGKTARVLPLRFTPEKSAFCPTAAFMGFIQRFPKAPHAGIVSGMSAMLRSLRIRNLALVEELSWELPEGFTAITGETGAGKSIIIGALKFLLGERADRSLVRSGASSAGIEAVFSLKDPRQIDIILEEHGIDPCQEGDLILKRSIASEGSGRQFINGSSCNLGLLKELGALLVDLHGPHDHQSLFSRREQTLLLDRYADAIPLRDAYLNCRAAVAAARREIEELEQLGGGVNRMEQLQEEVGEISSANLSEGEEEMLNSRYKAASNSRRLIEVCAAVTSRLEDEEHGAAVAIAEATRLLRDLTRLDERASVHQEALEQIGGGLETFLFELRDYAGEIEVDAGELQLLEDRLNLVGKLRRKYGPTLADVIERGTESAKQLERLSSLAGLRETARQRLAAASKHLAIAAASLGKKRREGASRLAATVTSGLVNLGFKQAGFEISLEPQTESGPDGAEVAEFLFAPNPGEPVKPLRAIASSGEISRVMLALKSALAAQDKIPLLVFDEIDANVGGEIASKVAGTMRELGAGHQVLCITHLPQVAAAATSQFVVAKSVREGRTGTRLDPVSGGDRVLEIARMLGGVSESAKAHAIALLAPNEGTESV